MFIVYVRYEEFSYMWVPMTAMRSAHSKKPLSEPAGLKVHNAWSKEQSSCSNALLQRLTLAQSTQHLSQAYPVSTKHTPTVVSEVLSHLFFYFFDQKNGEVAECSDNRWHTCTSWPASDFISFNLC